MVFTVDSTVEAVDAVPGDGACADACGACTLRAAIQETNALAGAELALVLAPLLSLSQRRRPSVQPGKALSARQRRTKP
jgi:hypothetical protein